MKPEQILFRTAKGEHMVNNHGRDISIAQRRALIAIDGRTSLSELSRKVVWVQNLEAVLHELCDLGLVTCDLMEMQTQTALTGTGTLVHKAQLIELARELLGKHAEKIIQKINASQDNYAALNETVLTCRKFIRLTVDADLAERFLARAQAIIDA